MPKWVREAILWWWGVLVVLWLSLGVARQLRSLLIQLVLALFLSFAMEPLVTRLSRRGLRRSVATAGTMLVLIAFCTAFLTAMGSLIAGQLRQLAADLPGYITSADAWAEERFNIDLETSDVIEQLQAGGRASDYLSSLADNLVGVGTGVLSGLFQVLTVGLFTFYLTADGPRLRQSICSVLPPARQLEVLRVWELAISKTGAFISSRFILAVISTVFHGIAFAVLDLPSSIALALWVGIISQFIPVIGIYIAGVVPALIALGIDPTRAIWVIIVLAAYQQIENYVLQPRVTAQTLNMHPAVAFGAVLAGSATFGASGALLALPFIATIQSFISAYVARHTVIDNPLVAARLPVPTSLADDDGHLEVDEEAEAAGAGTGPPTDRGERDAGADDEGDDPDGA